MQMGDDYRFRDVRPGEGHGQSNIGRGGRNYQDNSRHRRVDNRGGYYVGRDHHDHRSYDQRAYDQRRYYQDDNYHIDAGPTDPFDSMFSGRGVGRLLCALGLIIAFAGFGVWMWLIFQGMIADAGPGQVPDNPFKLELRPGIPIAPVAFGTMAVGGILASIGASMAKAARRRHDEAMRHRRRRYH
jgi:hypothetical protein